MHTTSFRNIREQGKNSRYTASFAVWVHVYQVFVLMTHYIILIIGYLFFIPMLFRTVHAVVSGGVCFLLTGQKGWGHKWNKFFIHTLVYSSLYSPLYFQCNWSLYPCSHEKKSTSVRLLSAGDADMRPAHLPLSVFLHDNCTVDNIISIKAVTGEECRAGGVKVFSPTIWLVLILWSASKNHSHWFPSSGNESSSKMNFLLGCGGCTRFVCSRR